jgi:chromosome segregation ATPase
MKNSVKAYALFAISLFPLGLASCESTGDPRQGGIFWSEPKARERLAVQRLHVQQAQREAAEQQATTARLRASREATNATVVRQRRELKQLGADISSLQGELAGNSKAGEEINSELLALERQRASLVKNNPHDVSKTEAELERLRAEVDHLKERNRVLRETH